MSDSKSNTDTKTKSAAGPWQQGKPDTEAQYLIKYRHRDHEGIHISTGRYLPDHGWLNKFPKMTIIAYAEINE